MTSSALLQPSNGSRSDSVPNTESSSMTLDSQEVSSWQATPPPISSTKGQDPGVQMNRRGKGAESESDNTTQDVDLEEDGGEGEQCDLGPITLQCCQAFRSTKVVLVFLCMVAVIQGMVVNGFVSVVISTIEKRYDLTSKQSGFIASGYDIASVLCLIPVSYFGGGGHKPRWIACGVLLLSLGSFLFALPHFLADAYKYNTVRSNELCHDSSLSSLAAAGPPLKGNSSYYTSAAAQVSGGGSCGAESQDGSTMSQYMVGSMSQYMIVFVVAQMLHGAGCTPIYTLAVTYLDENLKAKLVPVYLGVFYTTAIIGPAIGYIVGGQLLKIYCDVGAVDLNSLGDLNPDSSLWVGAWWIGFLISGSLSLALALPLSGFPKTLPGSAKLRTQRVSEVYKGSDVVSANPGFHLSIRDIPASLRILFTNPTFMSLNLAGACEGLLVSGFVVFAPKFVESQFSISAAWAAQLIGFATIPSGGGGTLFGGYLVKRLSLNCRGILRLCIITTCGALFLTLTLLARCADMDFAGVNVDYLQQNLSVQTMNLTAGCNRACACSKELYEPVCARESKVTYFSPCYAGCTSSRTDEGIKIYEKCSCISAAMAAGQLQSNSTDLFYSSTTTTFTTTTNLAATAAEGKCESSCQLLSVFLPIFALIIFVTFTTSMPALSVTLRCVPENQRSFALGIQWILFRCLGMIPAPILFGALIDHACLSWQQMPCSDRKGACFTYDNWAMGTYLLALVFCCKSLSLGFFLLAHHLYRPPPAQPSVEPATSDSQVGRSSDRLDGVTPGSVDVLLLPSSDETRQRVT